MSSTNLVSNSQEYPKLFKSVIVDKSIVVIGYKNTPNDNEVHIINMRIKAYELNYGPVIHFSVKVDVPYNPGEWSDHPLRIANEKREECINSSEDIIDDTPATRALIMELANSEIKHLYTTTDCSYRASIIAALQYFWS